MEQKRSVARPLYRLYAGFWQAIDWIYPPICGGCGRKGARWCQRCQASAQVIHAVVCEFCGMPNTRYSDFHRCQLDPPHYAALRSWAVFDGPVREAIHRLKYNRDIALTAIFAEYMSILLSSLAWPIDVIVPIPLNKQREMERGYNQSKLLALGMALNTGIPMRTNLIWRVRNTRSQVGLTYEQRKANVAEAFVSDLTRGANKQILLVDDVATSGATMDACAYALMQAGAANVYCLTLARAI
jgi:ComF family protein